MNHRSTPAVGAALGLTLLLAGCSSDPGAPGPTTTTDRPHGYVEGAREAGEPQLRLLAVSPDGRTTIHDLLTDESSELQGVDAPEHAATDGRFLVTSDDERTTITDGGAWTVDHGDHTHYYAADPRVVGHVGRGGAIAVHSSETTTTLTWPDHGEAVALDREALGQGEVSEVLRVEASVLLPFGDRFVAGDDGAVTVLDRGGRAVGEPVACPEPAGGIVTRAGAVIGCSDGAVVVDEDGATTVPLPEGSAGRPTSFAARAGRPTVAGVAGDGGAWLLDAREHSWRYVPSERPFRAVVAVDDPEGHVVAVDDTGRVVVVATADPTSPDGRTATTRPLVTANGPALLQVDAQRAYAADPTAGVVHEIDFGDDARVARTIELGRPVAALAEVGR
ncbi:ABC transporter [Curtobacterium sp. DN_7.5]|uniref:ABC transporter n=1 Tax=Curtobacterium sp. DN_7.5 TaxID=3049047 RepID=UPI001F58116C|nr:ABC transporter [Curtobacterium sp. DN_7.5]